MCFALLRRLRAARAGRPATSGPLTSASAGLPSVAPGTPAAVIVAAPPPLAAAPQAVPGAMPAPDAAGMPALPREPEVASATRTLPLARPFEPAAANQTVPLAQPDAATARGVPFVPPVLRGSAPLPNAPRRASESSAAFASDATAGPTSASASREPPAPADPRDTDRRFSALVLAAGPLREGAPDAAQRDALQRLEETIRGAPDRQLVPRMPALLPRLLGLVRRDDVSPRELAEPLARDPALLGEVIRLANSPRYRTLRAISSVQEAILLLGQRGLEQLLVRVVMGPVFDGRQGRYSRAAGTRVWDQAERCAHACGWLRRGAHDAFEAYLAGMVANSGLMVALRVLDRHLGDAKAPDTLGFHDALLDATGRLSLLIARQWSFPAAVVAALEARQGPEPGMPALAPGASADGQGALARALRAADRASKRLLLSAVGDSGASAQGEDEAACDRELLRVFGA